MKKSIFTTGIGLILGLLIGINTANAEGKTKAPIAATNKMMLEHVGMDCQTCHVIDNK